MLSHVHRYLNNTDQANSADPDQTVDICFKGPFAISVVMLKYFIVRYCCNRFITVKILCIGTDRSQQTVQTKIRLLLQKQSDQGLRCLPLHQLLLDALMQCYIKLYQF